MQRLTQRILICYILFRLMLPFRLRDMAASLFVNVSHSVRSESMCKCISLYGCVFVCLWDRCRLASTTSYSNYAENETISCSQHAEKFEKSYLCNQNDMHVLFLLSVYWNSQHIKRMPKRTNNNDRDEKH